MTDFVGIDMFEYTVTDSQGAVASAMVCIGVAPIKTSREVAP